MAKYEIKLVPIDSLLPNPLRPRFHVVQQKLLQLADSIRQYGLFHPLLVGRTSAGLQIISGDRRWKAARLAGLEEVPVVIVQAEPKDLLVLFAEENIQREPLNLLEQATLLNNLIKLSEETTETLCQRLQLEESTITDLIALLDLPESVKDKYLSGKLTDEELVQSANKSGLEMFYQSDTA